MSILYDTFDFTSGQGLSFTKAFTITAGLAMPVLIVHVGSKDNGSATYVTGVTYNGVAMTLGAQYSNGAVTQMSARTYYLLNPPIGASYNVVVSTNDNKTMTVILIASYYHVVGIGANGTDGGTDAVLQFSLTNSYHKSLVTGMFCNRRGAATLPEFTYDAAVTARGTQQQSGNNTTGCSMCMGDWTNAQAGISTTAGVTASTTALNASCGLELFEMRTRMII
jgi:hypothetical protein